MPQQTDNPQLSDSELKTGVWMVQVWLITGYNTDRHDIRCGGSPILGPFMWVVESHRDEFVTEMTKRYGNDHRVLRISVERRNFVQKDTIPTLEEELRVFEEYLAKPESWNC